MPTIRWKKLPYLILIVLLSSVCFAAAEGAKQILCGQIEQKYLYYSPDASAAFPVVVLLHGAGDQPENMLAAWKHLAARKGILLLAPALPRDLKYEDAAPAAFRCVVEDASHFTHIDPQRVYLFGNSMGGYLAFDAAMFESEYFAAIAVHANRIDEQYAGIVKKARRKTPSQSTSATTTSSSPLTAFTKRAICYAKKASRFTTWN